MREQTVQLTEKQEDTSKTREERIQEIREGIQAELESQKLKTYQQKLMPTQAQLNEARRKEKIKLKNRQRRKLSKK